MSSPDTALAEGWEHLGRGRFAEAEAVARAALERAEHDPGAWRLMGRAHLAKGDAASAASAFERAVAAAPTEPEPHYELGQARLQIRDAPSAIAAFRRVLELRPGDVRARLALGNAELARGAAEAALAHFEDACRKVFDAGEPHNNRGVALVRLERFAEAEAAFRTAVRAEPGQAAFHDNLLRIAVRQATIPDLQPFYDDLAGRCPDAAAAHYARARVEELLGRGAEAEAAAQTAAALDPGHADARVLLARRHLVADEPIPAAHLLRQAAAHRPRDARIACLLGWSLSLLHQWDEAEAHLRRAVELDPGFVPAHTLLATHLLTAGRAEEAADWLERARSLAPADTAIAASMAQVQEELSRRGAALDFLAPALATHPVKPGPALAAAVLANDRPSREAAIGWLEEALTTDPPPATRRTLRFALGRLTDRLGRHDEAFAHYQSGNAEKQAWHDPDQAADEMRRIRASYPAETFASFARSTCSSERPIFIVGMPRSGTTLAEQILQGHPAVHGAGELPYIGEVSLELPSLAGLSVPWPQIAPALTTGVLDVAASRYLERLARHDGRSERVTDKMPLNSLSVGLIRQMFPRARIVHCTRDWRDTCLSIYFQDFAKGHAYAYDLAHAAAFHRDHDEVMAHWRALGIEMFDLPYEQVVTDPEATVRRLLAFLGLPWDDRCLDFHASARPILTASRQQVREPLYRRSVERWRNYERHLKALGLEWG